MILVKFVVLDSDPEVEVEDSPICNHKEIIGHAFVSSERKLILPIL